jgi:dTMP kinase
MTLHRPWPGYFVSFEGGEGAGKSTQSHLLAERLRALGRTVVLTREPGGVPQGEALRELLLSGEPGRWTAMSEALMMYAARVEHWRLKISPALQRGEWVICDRFADSSMAYQGYAGALGPDTVAALHRLTLGGVQPDLTIVLDVSAQAGLERAAERVAAAGETATRFEKKDAAYHARLAEAFREIAKSNPHRCVLMDASGSKPQIAGDIWNSVTTRLGVKA